MQQSLKLRLLVNCATRVRFHASLHFNTLNYINGKNGKWLPILYCSGKRQHSISFVYRSYHLPMPSEFINADSLKLQLPTARKKEWRRATADSSPQAVTYQHCKYTGL